MPFCVDINPRSPNIEALVTISLITVFCNAVLTLKTKEASEFNYALVHKPRKTKTSSVKSHRFNLACVLIDIRIVWCARFFSKDSLFHLLVSVKRMDLLLKI